MAFACGSSCCRPKKKYIYIKLPGAENGIQYKWTRRYKFHFPSWRAKKNVCKPNERIYWRLLNGKRSIFNTHTNRINKQNIIAFEYETMLNGELCFQSNFIAPKCIMWLYFFPRPCKHSPPNFTNYFLFFFLWMFMNAKRTCIFFSTQWRVQRTKSNWSFFVRSRLTLYCIQKQI